MNLERLRKAYHEAICKQVLDFVESCRLVTAVEALRLCSEQAQVDEAAVELWGITDRELKNIRRSLEELG